MHYTFPQAYKPIRKEFMSKEMEIHANLDIGQLPGAPKPVLISVCKNPNMIESNNSKDLLTMPLSDPLADILAESQKHIEQYEIKLPSQREINIEDACNHRHTVADSYATEANSLISELRETTISHNEINAASPKRVEQRRSSFNTHLPNMSENIKSGDPDDSFANKTGDPLACHADNIMRMAMDSTMLRSFNNETISSSFSNVLDESILAKSFGEEHDDDDDDDGKLSPVKNTLNFSRATKVEISAHDLELAINDPFRL